MRKNLVNYIVPAILLMGIILAIASASAVLEAQQTAYSVIMGDNGTRDRKISIDASTRAIKGIDYAHSEVHSGNHYFMEGYATMASAAVLNVRLDTPDTATWSHLTWSISSSGILTTELYEDANFAVDTGVTVTPRNNNRNSANTSGLEIRSGVSNPASDGTLISQAKWGASGKFAASGGGDSRQGELVLKQGTSYYRKFTSGAADNIVQFRASWYEHTDKED